MNKSLAKVFVMTKNEHDTIEDFILFYGSLFGLENVIIVDNGSTHQGVLDVYDRYQLQGLNVFEDNRSMREMYVILTCHMRHFKDTCEFMLPLDTDEFIFFPEGGQMSRERVEVYLRSIPADVSVVRYKEFWGSSPNPEDISYVNYKHQNPVGNITRFHDQGWDKIMVRSGPFIQVYQGNHKAEVSSGKYMVSENLGLLHFHETGTYRQYEKALQGVKGYGFVDTEKSIFEQILDCHRNRQRAGGHHCSQYLKFLVRQQMINLWQLHMNDGSNPSKEDMMWVDCFADDLSVTERIVDYLNNRVKIKTPPFERQDNIMDLIYKYWDQKAYQYKTTQISDYIKRLDSPINQEFPSVKQKEQAAA